MRRINITSNMSILKMSMIPHMTIWMNMWIQMSNNISSNSMENMNTIKSITSTLISVHYNMIIIMMHNNNKIWTFSRNH